jgi:SAM-dependent methyltransferase
VRVGAIPENLLERVVMRLGVVPRPMIETQMAFTLARVIQAGVELGVFEELEKRPATSAEVAERLGTDPFATDKLLFALAAGHYLQLRNGRYEVTKLTRRWLLGENNLSDKLRFQQQEWEWLGQTEEYVRTGKPLELHEMTDPEIWDSYQRGMRAMSAAFSGEAVKRMPVPKGARDMLDIGGSHGLYSVGLCRRHDGLRAVVLDLPAAVEKAAPLLAAEGMGDRVVHRAGDVLADDLGEEVFDFVLIAQVVHHFSDEQNRALAAKVARALRPGGVYSILDAFRPSEPGESGQLPSLLEFYFALTSQSGTWTPEEMAEWQRSAGLRPSKPLRLRSVPGGGIQSAVK